MLCHIISYTHYISTALHRYVTGPENAIDLVKKKWLLNMGNARSTPSKMARKTHRTKLVISTNDSRGTIF